MNIKNKIQYFFIIAAFHFLASLPLFLLFLISEVITFFVYYVIRYRREVVLNNLINSFPDLELSKIHRISRKYYRHLSVMIVENIYLRFISKKNIRKRLIFKNKELFDQLYESKKNVIIMMGHFGNWEFAGGLSNLIPYKGAAVYKKLSSPVFDKIYFDIRTRVGVQPIEMKESFRQIYNLNKQKDPFALFMVADQAPMKNETHHWMQFLNQETGVFLGSEKLAKKFDMAVVYIELLRYKKGIYKVIPTLITENPNETADFEITEKYFHLLEESINRSPRYWTWSHRRWKNKGSKMS
ncbi:MAG: lysophospholipid acyltransferase family protein [Salinivirgaceae bacterium]|nr:lysophospholipid acyltransferase family protein [Salinivirgaceae bacterium]